MFLFYREVAVHFSRQTDEACREGMRRHLSRRRERYFIFTGHLHRRLEMRCSSSCSSLPCKAAHRQRRHGKFFFSLPTYLFPEFWREEKGEWHQRWMRWRAAVPALPWWQAGGEGESPEGLSGGGGVGRRCPCHACCRQALPVFRGVYVCQSVWEGRGMAHPLQWPCPTHIQCLVRRMA